MTASISDVKISGVTMIRHPGDFIIDPIGHFIKLTTEIFPLWPPRMCKESLCPAVSCGAPRATLCHHTIVHIGKHCGTLSRGGVWAKHNPVARPSIIPHYSYISINIFLRSWIFVHDQIHSNPWINPPRVRSKEKKLFKASCKILKYSHSENRNIRHQTLLIINR